MKTFDNERILDYISTKGGRSIPKPTFGDRITIADWVKKEEPKKERIKRKLTCLEKLQRAGYVRTYIECSLGIVVLNRIVVFRECSRIYSNVRSVYYSDLKGERYSQLYYK